MSFNRISIPVQNKNVQGLTVVIEPWAEEVQLSQHEECVVILIGKSTTPEYAVELSDNQLIFLTADSTVDFEIWKDTQQIC